MKRYSCFLLIFLLSLPFTLWSQIASVDTSSSATWKEVHRLISIKNYAETLPLLQEIKSAAAKKNNRGEWIRAILAESVSLRINQTNDEAFSKIRQHFEEHIKRTQHTERAILQNHYAQFLLGNIHRSLSQSNDPFISKKYNEKIQMVDSLFSESLKEKELLIEEPIQHWAGMLAELRTHSAEKKAQKLSFALNPQFCQCDVELLAVFQSSLKLISSYSGEVSKNTLKNSV